MRKRWIKIVLALVLVIGAIAAYYIIPIYNFASHISNKSDQDTVFNKEQDKKNPPPKWERTDRVNILVLGSDSRESNKNERPRSDSMIVLSIDPVTKKAAMMSILRDLYVKIPDHGENRINAALAFGGPNLAMKTASDLLDIPIQYYVYTDFEGFISLVDAIGGITLDVEKDMKWVDSADKHVYDIDLKKGVQHMDGKTALQYVRFRHDNLHNIGRSERQRKFISAVFDKMKSFSSIVKLPLILNKMEPYIQTNIQPDDMTKLASLALNVNTSDIQSVQIPPNNLYNDKRINGMAVVTSDKKKLQQYVQDVFSGKIAEEAKLKAEKEKEKQANQSGENKSKKK
ncbi:LytR family transcriptional regulator [Paenibacillus albiflavus]|uniref:LytR family transcriptional regulator n=1 Tax=Paenibacillus albiflavus TaxID=2545760 RepID=A0A4R4EHC7_9BACL|nr:LCP family protein [Paenibacillus albiflavus]TCZ77681.1 LytR family transcriptional regulator [Paenibacillus albiflavus]